MGGQREPHCDRPRRSRFGEWLTTWRLAAGLRQSDVAARLGVNSGRISEWEQGRRCPTGEQRDQLRELFGPEAPPPPGPRRILGECAEAQFRGLLTPRREDEEAVA